MSVWEITNKWMNDVASYARTAQDRNDPGFRTQFGTGGTPLSWQKPPHFTIKNEKGGKNKPRADVNTINAPGFVLNARAKEALGDFLMRFGELLEVDVDGAAEYYYNATNVISCLDDQRSNIKAGYVATAVFKQSAIPSAPTLFMDPSVVSRVFVNTAAKAELDARIAKSGIIGMSFTERESI